MYNYKLKADLLAEQSPLIFKVMPRNEKSLCNLMGSYP